MKTHLATILTGITMIAVSCENEDSTLWDDPNFIRITVSTEPMNLLNGSSDVELTEKDVIMVFDRNNTGVELHTTDEPGTDMVYYSHEWTGNAPSYASYHASSSENATCTSDGLLGVTLETEQKVGNPETYGPGTIVSVGKVTGNSTGYRLNPMKNITGLIRVTMNNSTAKSIRIEAAGGEIMSGRVNVDYTRLENGENNFWSPADGAGMTYVEITPLESSAAATEDGCLKAGSYYAAVLPQTYSQGFLITVTCKDGSSIVRKFHTEGLEIPRREPAETDDALDDTLPDEIVIDLQFYNENDINPLGEFVSTAAGQTAAGEDYTYVYDYLCDGIEMSMDLSFTVSKGSGASASQRYQYTTVSGVSHNVYFNPANNGWVRLPGIPGRYLKSVSMFHGNNTAAKRFRLQEEPPTNADGVGRYFSSTPLVSAPSATEPIETSVTVPTGTTTAGQLSNTEAGRSYTMQFTTGASLRIFRIRLVYTKDEPVADTPPDIADL